MRKKEKKGLPYLLTPEYMFEHYYDVTPEFLNQIGVRALLIDIDNTLAPYEQDTPDERILDWFDGLSKNGIKSALISNNHPDRVNLFNESLRLPAYADSGKPGGKYLIEAMKTMGVEPTETAGLGDQLLTDTLAVHRLGMVSIIVPPIKDKTSLFFKSKRLIEKPFIKRYKKLHKKGFP